MPGVLINGLGLVTPLGCGGVETWRALLAGKYITTHSRSAGGLDLHAMVHSAACEAMSDAGWGDRERCAVIVGTSKGPVTQWLADATPLSHMVRNPCVVGGSEDAFGVACAIPDLGGPGPRLTL